MKISQTKKCYISSRVDGHVNSNWVKKSSYPSAAPPAHSPSSREAVAPGGSRVIIEEDSASSQRCDSGADSGRVTG